MTSGRLANRKRNGYAGGPFVQGVVDLVVLALHFGMPLPAEELPQEENPDIARGISLAEHHAAAVRAESFVDQRGSSRPEGAVERRLVQHGHDAFERLPLAHERAFACAHTVGPIPMVSADVRPTHRRCAAGPSRGCLRP